MRIFEHSSNSFISSSFYQIFLETKNGIFVLLPSSNMLAVCFTDQITLKVLFYY